MILEQPPVWAERFVGIPFADGGRDMSAADCWGLVRLAMKERVGVELGEYATISEADYPSVAEAIGGAKASGEWESVPAGLQKPLDIVEMSLPARQNNRISFLPLHVGLMVSKTWILHTEQATGSRLSYVTDKQISPRILGYWRHHALQ